MVSISVARPSWDTFGSKEEENPLPDIRMVNILIGLSLSGPKTRFPEGGYPAEIRPPDGFSVTSRMEPVLVSLFKGDNAKIRQFYSNDINFKLENNLKMLEGKRFLVVFASVTSRKIHPEDSSGGRISGEYLHCLP